MGNYIKGTLLKGPLKSHRNWITNIVFKPLHLNCPNKSFATSSKDCTVKIWDLSSGNVKITLAGHNKSVTTVVWTGTNIIITGAQDRTINLYDGETGNLLKSLNEHAHWINYIALSSEYTLSTGAYDPLNQEVCKLILPEDNPVDLKNLAITKWERFNQKNPIGETFVSCSDDFTLILWNLKSILTKNSSKKPISRMTGHQNIVMSVKFSPDSRTIASCALDRSVRLWCGKTGQFLTRLTGHVGSVYQISWSPDSRLLMSGSADSTLKLWSLKTKKFHSDLPGHLDEVYAIDWSNDGSCAASGGKDKVV